MSDPLQLAMRGHTASYHDHTHCAHSSLTVMKILIWCMTVYAWQLLLVTCLTSSLGFLGSPKTY